MISTETELTYLRDDKSCSIIVRSGIRNDLLPYLSMDNYSKIVVLTDEHVAKNWLAPLRDALGGEIQAIVIPPGEKEKSLERATEIWEDISRMGCDRYSLLIAFGGGVIGDLGGFVASVFARGMSFVQIPTSLMAQVDASIGGKSSVNLSGVKNQIGSFYPPEFVFVDPDFLQTLPQREVVSGFAEVIKHALLFDEDRVRNLKRSGIHSMIGSELESVIADSIRVKARVVEQDPFEKSGERQLLNFGHTVGHALEAISLDTVMPLTHGEAVSLGMLCEAEISRHLGYLSEDHVTDVRELLLAFSLPTSLSFTLDKERVCEVISHDKKSRAGAVRWAVLEKIGLGKHGVIVDTEVVRDSLDVLVDDGKEG